MSIPEPMTLLRALRAESARFRAVLAEAPIVAVPSCPDWDTDDLLWHLGEVQWFWATIVAGRPQGPESLSRPSRPEDRAGLLALSLIHI